MIKQFGPSGQHSNERSLLLRSEGPILDVVIKKSKILSGRNFRGLIDTGASVNCIDNMTARKLGLPIIDYKQFQSASGQNLTPVYVGIIDIAEVGIEILGQFYGAELGLGTKSYHCLLGRPFLSNFIFSYDGPDGVFQLAQPSTMKAHMAFDE
ncbi:retropepsin-like aspartic protease [Litorimonas sp. RW-G-Af-16]|uniref:retropepsin-like aspartic protease n=1 Tax=Litorimonas sp. RW-G-Af-16 TaxID=3241168 RepID=UPI00390C68F0